MSADQPSRTAILAALAAIKPPSTYDEAAMWDFVGARQHLIDELAALEREAEGPLSDPEARDRAAAASSSKEAIQVMTAERKHLMALLAEQRRARAQLLGYGHEPPHPSVRGKG